jgi:zinc transport system substrate-binding protein
MRKNLIASILVLCLCISTLIGCSNSKNIGISQGSKQDTSQETNQENKQDSNAKELSIVCTIFPQYDWVREILGDRADQAELTLLLDNGVDLHSYQPTAEDITKIISCDLFIYVGGESDQWVNDVLAEATNKDMKVINMLEVLGDNAKEEEIVEGMEAEEEEHAEEGQAEEGQVEVGQAKDSEEEAEYDEHVWLSLKNAEVICKSISAALSDIDIENGNVYEENRSAYETKLADLDKDYQKTVDSATRTTLLIGDRFPFRYLVDDYGLDYYAAFVGCSAETEASFETIVFLAEKTEELKLPAVCVLESSNQEIAKTIISNTKTKDQKVLVLDSMQSITAVDVTKGEKYLSIMNHNLQVLKEALN